MFFYLIALLFILLYGAGVAGKGQWQAEPFSKTANLPIRGFFTLLVIFHHLSQQLSEPGCLKCLWEIGPFCVAVFFYFSGYGLMVSYKKDPAYLAHFFPRRYGKLLVPFVLSNYLYLFADVMTGSYYSYGQMVKFLAGVELINGHAWFIVAILLFYLAFYLIFGYVKKAPWNYLLLFGFTFCYMTFCMLQNNSGRLFSGRWWFNSCGLFPVGVLFAVLEEPLTEFCRRRYFVFVWGSLAALGICSRFFLWISARLDAAVKVPGGRILGLLDQWAGLVWQMLAIFLFCFLLTLAALKISFHNRLLRFLGSRSLELYLIHGLFIRLFRRPPFMVESDALFIGLVLGCSALASAVLYRPVALLTKSVECILTNPKYLCYSPHK